MQCALGFADDKAALAVVAAAAAEGAAAGDGGRRERGGIGRAGLGWVEREAKKVAEKMYLLLLWCVVCVSSVGRVRIRQSARLGRWL
jgi:hypothetical protein